MSEISPSIDKLFNIREQFMVIGLTGRTGSGCSTAGKLLNSEFNQIQAPTPQSGNFLDNEGRSANDERKYKILYTYAKDKWQKFELIKVRDVIASFILKESFDDFTKFILETLSYDSTLQKKVEASLPSIKTTFDSAFNVFTKINDIDDFHCAKPEIIEIAYKFYFEILREFTNEFNKILKDISQDIFIKLYQKIGDNIRSSGSSISSEFNSENIFSIAARVNQLIKIIRAKNKNEKPTFIVIDALRNPFESQYFKERYSAFYLMAINTPEEDRKSRLRNTLTLNTSQINEIDNKEYPEKLVGYGRFVSQDIQKCIEISDIHINNPNQGTLDTGVLKRQLIWFVSLALHPGLVIPTATERAMQIAYTAKLNSGCISRQVGAVVTDRSYSVKAVGWNNTPEGQVPCLLRRVEDLLNNEDKQAFSDYEINNLDFKEFVANVYKDKLDNVGGRNISFCFKDIQNSFENKKNQVHTRSLHAEENAFLQISKYGGEGVVGGILFTTASPCELCAKKAYQLGIERIVFIDPYPGIATSHVLGGGTKKVSLELFSGAIGKAYHQLYQSFIPYKDELNILFDIELPKKKQDETQTKETDGNEKNNQLIKENINNEEEINQLKAKIKELENELAEKSLSDLVFNERSDSKV